MRSRSIPSMPRSRRWQKKPVSVIVSNINFGDVDGVSFLDTVPP
jgi:hypothetical protein